MSQQISKGETFTDTSPGNLVNAQLLNQHVDGATLLNGAVIDQVALSRVTSVLDTVLIGDNTQPDTGAPAKVTLDKLAPETVRNQSQVYAAASSADPATVYAVTLTPAATAYTAGMTFRFRADHACAAAAQINVNANGAVALVKYGGTALATSDIGVGQIVECVYDSVNSNFQIISPLTSTPVAAIQAQTRNLLAFNDAGTPNTKVDVTADAVMLLDTSFNSYLARSVSLVIDSTTTGANGLDTGSMANSTWYYLWVIYKSSTNTVAGLISTSSSAPTLPSGYSFKTLVGAVYRGSGGAFATFYQQDREVWIAEKVIFTGKTAAAAATWESYSAGAGGSDLNMNTVVPPIALRLRGFMGSVASQSADMAVAADASGVGAQYVVITVANPTTFNTYSECAPFAIPLRTAQTFYWQSLDNTTPRNRLSVTGYGI